MTQQDTRRGAAECICPRDVSGDGETALNIEGGRLSLPALEGKIVQKGMARIVETIYEQGPAGLPCGFRPSRGGHHALRAVDQIIMKRRTRYMKKTDSERAKIPMTFCRLERFSEDLFNHLQEVARCRNIATSASVGYLYVAYLLSERVFFLKCLCLYSTPVGISFRLDLEPICPEEPQPEHAPP